MKKFLICLAPAILAYVAVIIAAATSSNIEMLMEVSVLLLGIGALVSAGFVSVSVYQKMETEKWSKILVSILCFAGVAIAYFAVSMAGCCGLAGVSGVFH